MTTRLFVTGGSGFVGGHLATHVAAARPDVFLVDAPEFDLNQRSSLDLALEAARPDWVVHLAAQSAVPQSFADPRGTYEVNFLGTLNLLEALAARSFDGRLLFVGSGDAYGRVADADLPVRETLPLRPRNPYAVSKAAAEALCYQWSQTGPFEIVITRLFNSLGTGQSPRFAVADFAQRIADIATGRAPPRLVTGDLDVTRDFTDVRDVVRAYRLLAERGAAGQIYNVSSGHSISAADQIALLNELIAPTVIDHAVDPARVRAHEVMDLCGANDRIRADTSWEPEIPFRQTMLDTLRWWEHELRESATGVRH